MKQLLSILFALSLAQAGFGQNYWVKKQAGGNVDETLAVANDSEGNVYATGYFSATADVNEQSLSGQGLTDIFVSKLSLQGEALWSVSFGGAQSDRGLGITVDADGQVWVCGFYTGFVDFGNGVTLTAQGGQDAFLLKLDAAGLPLWARGYGSPGNSDRANAVAVDSLGNGFITGQFSGDASFDGFDLNATDGSIDAFLIKCDTNGNALWVKQGTAESLERGMALATDKQGAVYLTGQFSGDLTFDGFYGNNVLNAIFLVKYTAEGEEAWIRSAGGTQESIAYGMTADGENIYVTGDCGSSITILGGGLPETINTGYANAFFIFSFADDGSLNWSATAGSESLVSSRAIDYFNGELSVAGYFRCTFDAYSDAYGSGTFNAIGFEDAFAARYNAQNGDFMWSRNFGSQTDEQALGVALLHDGEEVICGAFTGELILPAAGMVSGSSGPTFYDGVESYCGDTQYSEFAKLTGSQEQDGFLVKVLTESRAPYDFFLRQEGASCEPTMSGPCLQGPSGMGTSCPDTATICLNDFVGFSPMTYNNEIAFDYELTWTNPDGGADDEVSTEGLFSVLMVSEDGCYVSSDDLYVNVAPDVLPGLISDNVVVNDQALDAETVSVCEGDTVLVWATYPEDLSGYWESTWGQNLGGAQDTLVATNTTGLYLELENEFGCNTYNDLQVEFSPTALDLPVDIYFPNGSDTISICDNWFFGEIEVRAVVEGTTSLYPNEPYNIDWSVNQNASIGNSSDSHIGPVQDGWHVVSVTVTSTINECSELEVAYTAVDSVYIQFLEAPDVSINVEGPTAMCPGEMVVLHIEHTGNLNINNLAAEAFADSAYITAAGTYPFWVDSTAANGCYAQASAYHTVNIASSPQIFTDPPNAVICPNDSVQVLSDTEGAHVWQGPQGSVTGSNSLWVEESGLYFAEVTLYEGCVLVSNTIQLTEYATPFLFAEDGLICEGGTEEIWVVSNSMETIEWQPPLTGNAETQVVTEAGWYTVEVTGCEVTTDIGIEILSMAPEVQIYRADDQPVCAGDSILVLATGDFDSYLWSPAGEGDSRWFANAGPVSVIASMANGDCQTTSDTLEINFEPIPPGPTFDYVLPCEGGPVEVLIASDYEVNALDGPNGAVVSNDSVQYIAQLYGDTTLYAYVASAYCSGDTVALQLTAKPYPEQPIPASDAPVCTGTNLALEVLNTSATVSYHWLVPNGDLLQGGQLEYGIADLSQEGTYLVYANMNGCHSDTVAIPVDLFETRQVVLPPDTALCFYEGFFVEPDTTYAAYLWSDNSTGFQYYPNGDDTDEISLLATDFNGCSSIDYLSVYFASCVVDIPNVITPNGDGMNDQWIIQFSEPRSFQAMVYSRSGRIVFESNDPSVRWDGTHPGSGTPCPEGVYFYVVQARDFEGRVVEEQGNLTLLRD